MKKLLWAGAPLLCMLLARPAWAGGIADRGGVQAVVNSGHRGPVLALDWDARRGLLFSGGADGTVRIWAGRILIRGLTVTNLRVGMLAADPDAPRVAVLGTDGIRSYSVDVWDWEQEKLLFTIPLDDAPLFMRYSTSGRYLLFGLPRWKSLRIMDAGSGSPVPLQQAGEGIIALASLSRTEKVLMTYRLTGALSFWELSSGRLLAEKETTAGLSHLRISHDLSFIVGSTGSEVQRIDPGTGAVQARVTLEGVTSLDIAPSDDSVACSGEGGAVSRWTFVSGVLTPEALPPAPGGSVVRFGPDALYVGGRDGSISAVPPAGDTQVLPGDQRASVTGSAVRGEMLALATVDWLKVFVSGLADTARAGSRGAGPLREIQVANPLRAAAGVRFLDDSTLLIYRNADGPGEYRIFDITSGSFRPSLPPLPGPIVDAQVEDQRCLLLSRDGTIRLIDLPGGAPRFEVSRPGAVDAALLPGGTVVVAGDPGVGARDSLVRIDLNTGETDPVRSRNRYTYAVLFDPRTAVLYSLGVDADGATSLLARTGSDFQTETPVATSRGEHLGASMTVDPADDALYTTLGRDRISCWKNGTLTQLRASARGAVALGSGAGVLYALNQDSTVSLSSPGNGDPLAELSVFRDGGWVLTMLGGHFAASPGADSLVNVLENGKAVQDKGAYLVPVQVTEGR